MSIPHLSFPKELRNRILFTIGVLVIYRVGVQVPTPGVDTHAVLSFFEAQGGGVFGLLNTFTGGALNQFSVLALGIIPYITSSIIFQLLQTGVPYFEQLKKEGESGRNKLNQYTRYATIPLSIFQGYGIAKFLQAQTSPEGLPLIVTPYFGMIPFSVFTIITLTTGSCLIMWLGERINEKGVGNGASLIIYAGIAAGIPSGAINLFQMIKNGEMTGGLGLLLLAFMILVIGFIIFIEAGQRRLPVQYSQRALGKQPATQSSHLPLKLNLSGVLPPIFASSMLLFPTTIAQYVDVEWLQAAGNYLSPGSAIFNLFFVGLIVFFCFFYTDIVFNPTEVADNLKKYGGFIPGIRAGRHTAEHVKKTVDRLTVGGATYLSLVCILPTILIAQMNVPFYFGGTGLLILVGVALDTTQQIQSHLLSAKYEGFVRGVRMKSRRVQY